MKKVLFIFSMMMLIVLSSHAQKDVTTFLGIPVDGTKTEMKRKLINKGYTLKSFQGNEFLEGEFNGADVRIYIATNNNKVCRIMVCEANTCDEANIKIRFNNLVRQFSDNERYTTLEDYTLSEEENISYEMIVHKKTYDAIYYQKPKMELLDTLALAESIQKELLKKYTEEQFLNPTEEIIKEATRVSSKHALDIMRKKAVWFRICKAGTGYYLTIFYDNEYNRANGEDL